jgi:uncharacterized repeat protein (TIGR03803 family)
MRFLARFTIGLAALSVASLGHAQSFNVIYTFPNPSAGWDPQGTPYIGADGVLFGTTVSGGQCPSVSDGCGTVFSITPPSQSGGPWVESVLYSFSGVLGVENPEGGVIPGPNGTLVGTTASGGTTSNSRCQFGCGTLFELVPPAQSGDNWSEQVLYYYPQSNFSPAELLPGPNGVYYGATLYAGDKDCFAGYGCGSIYALLPPSEAGGAWSVDELHIFHQTDGAFPFQSSRLVSGPDGVLYGTASGGGDLECSSLGCGVVFSLTPPVAPATAWTFQDLYKFKNPSDGDVPQGGLTLGPHGILYGTTYYGGVDGCIKGSGCGTVFSLAPPSSGTGQWIKTILHSFTGGNDGANPYSALLLGAGGVLYGVTPAGGGTGCQGQGCGILYQLIPPAQPGGSWKETILHAFTGASDGLDPTFTPAMDSKGVLYGYSYGGAGTLCNGSGCGVVYQYVP